MLKNKRLFYVPTVAFQGQLTQVLYRGGRGSEEVPGGIEFINNPWQLGFSLTYPLFQGNTRRINMERSRVQLDQLNYSRESLDQNLELSVKTNSLQLLNATTNIVFSRTSSDNAQKNYELVQENYKQGAVSIIQLIDAQQAALQAKLGYALSVYNYLQSQLQLEFTLGFFFMFATPEELNNFEERFLQFRADN